MKIYPVTDAGGKVCAIEVDVAYIGFRTLADIIQSVSGVTDVYVRKHFSRSGDTRVKFRVHGREFVVVEPFGDNSRYWIGPAAMNGEDVDMSAIGDAIRSYKPSFLRRLLGGIVTFDIRSIFRA